MQTEVNSTPRLGPNGTNWNPTGLHSGVLGVCRAEDPDGYLRAYRKAYNALHKKPPAVFLTDAQKHERYLANLAKQAEARRSKKDAAEAALTPEQVADRLNRIEAHRAAMEKRRHDRQLAKQARDRRNNPEKYHERRAKKVGWAEWAAFKPLYEEARRLTSETGVAWNIEHIYPIKSDWVCGLHTPDNLRVATRSENLRKGSRPFGPLGDELWEPDHYRVYWTGESVTYKQKKALALKVGKAAQNPEA